MSSQSFNVNHTIFHDIAHWLHQEPSLVGDLYSSPFVVQAVFRALPPIARLYIPRLLSLPSDHPIPIETFRQTLRRRQRAYDRHDTAIRALRSLHIIVHPSERTEMVDLTNIASPAADTTSLCLNAQFTENLRCAITYGVPSVFDGPIDDSIVSIERLDKFSADRLENILNYVVESSGRHGPSGNIISSLVHTHILEENRNALCISSSGFHFLLKHSFAQLWILLRSILIACFSRDVGHPLKLLFALSFTHPGALYSTFSLSERQCDILGDLHELGIIILSTGGESFRPTLVGVRLLSSANRVGADLTSADLPNVTKTSGEIDIFVETNFRVYAYTTSEFQTNLLGLFTHVRCRLPGMVAGHLTREAVRRALMNGITADQIIAYLNAHAHPRMKKGLIPPNVSDEIRLWEAEQERVRMTPGVLLTDFHSPSAFERVLEFGYSVDAVLWSNVPSCQLIVGNENYEAVKQFVRREGLQ